jgi:hemerythrin-like metal-binding protein/diguanylate cyclase (GGDEF)-like protein
MVEAFKWDQSFATGIEVVDLQHQGLVEIINEAGTALSQGNADPETMQAILARLFDYAGENFRTEEGLMREHGLDPRHTLQHAAEHQHFVSQLRLIKDVLDDGANAIAWAMTLGFLAYWRSFHNLDLDQRMALQMRLIAHGTTAALAYDQSVSVHASDASRKAMVSGLIEIYRLSAGALLPPFKGQNTDDADLLTGLLNRSRFLHVLAQRVIEIRVTGGSLVLLLVDVDDLASLNQSMSYAVADQLLIEIGRRLRESTRNEDQLARIGDDEFAVLLNGGHEADIRIKVAERLFERASQRFSLAGRDVPFSLSGGLAILPADALDVEALVGAASLALAAARREGGGVCRRYMADMGASGPAHVDAAAELRYAITHGELVLHYQPQVSLYSGAIVGLEALVRWNHPERGLISPAQFIPLAEETGLIVALGNWVMREAISQIRAWREQDLGLVRVAVNLSARSFHLPDLPDLVDQLLREHDVPANLLEIELTESIMMHDPDIVIGTLNRLHGVGVKLSLDDFGTGYSSLAYLSRLSLDTLKIDQSFVRDITTNPVNASIAVATIAMAHKLGKSVVAEGVETEGQMLYLRRHDCDVMQGYLFSRPVPAEAITEMLRLGINMPLKLESDEDMPCLLLVDDEESILHALKRMLRLEGYRILTAQNASTGLELLASNKVQVVLSDQRMPEMTGTEFLTRVKDLYPDTVRMVLSGYSEINTVTEAINRGAIYRYLSKPWRDDEVKQEIRSAFRHHAGTLV